MARWILRAACREGLSRHPLRQSRYRTFLEDNDRHAAPWPPETAAAVPARPEDAGSLYARRYGERRDRADGFPGPGASACRECLDGWHDRPGHGGRIPRQGQLARDPDVEHQPAVSSEARSAGLAGAAETVQVAHRKR